MFGFIYLLAPSRYDFKMRAKVSSMWPSHPRLDRIKFWAFGISSRVNEWKALLVKKKPCSGCICSTEPGDMGWRSLHQPHNLRGCDGSASGHRDGDWFRRPHVWLLPQRAGRRRHMVREAAKETKHLERLWRWRRSRNTQWHRQSCSQVRMMTQSLCFTTKYTSNCKENLDFVKCQYWFFKKLSIKNT